MTMKKTLLMAALVALTTMSCGNNSENNANGADSAVVEAGEAVAEAEVDKAAYPWDFPREVALDAKEGQIVLAAWDYERRLKEGKDLSKQGMSLLQTEMAVVGKDFSQVKRGDYKVPNLYIIPIPEGQTAKKGDLIVTWNIKGGGDLQRAYVTDASNPAEPKVNYMDMMWNDDPEKPGFGNRFADTQLPANSFYVLKDGEWMPGAQVAVKEGTEWKNGRIISIAGDKLFLQMFANAPAVAKKSDCRLIPVNEDLKAGDEVWALFTSTYKPNCKIEKVDKARGLITVINTLGKPDLLPWFEVTKVLD